MNPSVVMSRRDLDFLLFEWLDTESLLARERFAEHSTDTVEAVIDLAESLARIGSPRTTGPPTSPSRRTTGRR